MEDKFTYDRKGYKEACDYLDFVKDIIRSPTYSYNSNDGFSLIQYANDIYKRLNK